MLPVDCYYSNLIEDHDTHPVDIYRALHDDYSANPEKRDLQLEAKAHIAVQEWIDSGGLEAPATSKAALLAIHQRFCDQLPDRLLWVNDSNTHESLPVVPAELRRRDVQVGRHIPVSPGAVERFLDRFEGAYDRLGKTDAILAAAAAHHRLLWIHPFTDGNGRVARLMTHALLGQALDTGNIWSASRGLARSEARYKALLSGCDAPRRNDLDGRGTLSEEALADFTAFFLEMCLDQIHFMERLLEPSQLRARIATWAADAIRANQLAPKADIVLDALLDRGQIQRGELPYLLGVSDRQARRVVQSLFRAGAVHSHSPRSPLQPKFPATLAPRWLPGLLPEPP
jgi:Fic family protein